MIRNIVQTLSTYPAQDKVQIFIISNGSLTVGLEITSRVFLDWRQDAVEKTYKGGADVGEMKGIVGGLWSIL